MKIYNKSYKVDDIISKSMSKLKGDSRKLIHDIGRLINVPSYGNCRFYALTLWLIDLDIEVLMNISAFRKMIYNYITENQENCCPNISFSGKSKRKTKN